jgi:hypothetical protein
MQWKPICLLFHFRSQRKKEEGVPSCPLEEEEEPCHLQEEAEEDRREPRLLAQSYPLRTLLRVTGPMWRKKHVARFWH